IVIVSKVCTHAGDRTPVFSQSDPRQKGNLFESAITLILKQGIRHVVIRHEGIQIAVLIVVFECHTHPSARPVHQPRRLGHILKSPIATVTVELVVNSSEISRVAVDTQIALPVTAVPFVDGTVFDVIDNEEIQPSIIVVVKPAGCDRPEIAVYPGLFRYLFKSAVTPVSVEEVLKNSGHEKVDITIIVKVADCNSH